MRTSRVGLLKSDYMAVVSLVRASFLRETAEAVGRDQLMTEEVFGLETAAGLDSDSALDCAASIDAMTRHCCSMSWTAHLDTAVSRVSSSVEAPTLVLALDRGAVLLPSRPSPQQSNVVCNHRSPEQEESAVAAAGQVVLSA